MVDFREGWQRPAGWQPENRLSGSCVARLGSLTAIVLGLVVSGCGSNTPEPAEDGSQAADRGVASAEQEGNSKGVSAKKGKGKKKSGDRIGEIPRDAWPEIWFDNPSAVAAETGSVKPSVPAATADAGEKMVANPGDGGGKTEDPALPAETAKPAGGSDWGTFLTAEALADETKAIRANLNAKLQSVGQFNGAYREVQIDATTLAALAQIAAEYADGPGWKKNAPLVRDVSAELSREADSVGDKFYKPTRAAFDKLESLLSGSVPPGLGESPPKMAFHSFAPRLALMKRLDRAHNWLKSNVNSADLLKKESERVIREAGVLASLSQVILVGGYDSADDELYQTLVLGVRDGAVKAAAAARDQDFTAYAAALDQVYKSCTKCHSEFKNN